MLKEPDDDSEPVRKLADELLAICDEFNFDCRVMGFQTVDENGFYRAPPLSELPELSRKFEEAIVHLRSLPDFDAAVWKTAERQSDRLLTWARVRQEEWRKAGLKTTPRNPLLSPWTPLDQVILDTIEGLQNEGRSVDQIAQLACTKGIFLKMPITGISERTLILGGLDGFCHDSKTNFRLFTVKSWIESLIIRGERNER